MPSPDRGGVRPPLLVIAGATATGKSGLSLRLAESLRAEGTPAEIISADSRKVYRGLDVATAKASPADRARVPHHGLDLVDPDAAFSVADYVAAAGAALDGIAARGGLAILVGGTGLYLRAVARGLDIDALPSDPEVRARLEADLGRDGLAAQAVRLAELAPGLAAQIDLRNPRRVVRALEIASLVGDRPRPAPRGYPGPVAWAGLAVDRPAHDARIAGRVRAQVEAGLLDEAARLRERWDPSLPAFSAFGYREAWAVLDGALTLEAAIGRIVQRTAIFARRQRTWFRAEPGIEWLDPVERDPLERTLAIARALVRPG
jgi:tRNA dimethylallyltransferase